MTSPPEDFIEAEQPEKQAEFGWSNKGILSVNSSAKKNKLEKETNRFNRLVKSLQDIETLYLTQKKEKEQEAESYRQKCLPELIRLSDTKLLLLLKAEKILGEAGHNRKLAAQFNHFVALFADDVLGLNEALDNFVTKYEAEQYPVNRKKNSSGPDNFSGAAKSYGQEFEHEYPENAAATENRSRTNKIGKTIAATIDVALISVQDLYKYMAKTLHPDLERDEKIKIEKGKWMQEMGLARDQKNLFGLLQIRQKTDLYFNAQIDEKYFNADRLKIYNKLLDTQIQQYTLLLNQLQKEKYYTDPNGYLQTKTPQSIAKNLDRDLKMIRQMRKAIETDSRHLKDTATLTEWMRYFCTV